MKTKLKFIVFFFLILSLSGCFNSAEKKMLDKVKASTINEYSKCVGVNGKVDYDIFKPLNEKDSEQVRISISELESYIKNL